VNKSTLPDRGTITVSGFDYIYSGWSFVDNGDGTGSYTFSDISYRDSNNEIQSGVMDDVEAGLSVRVSQPIDYMGIPYYQSQLNEFVRALCGAFNSIEGQGYDLNGELMGDRCFFRMLDPQGQEFDLMRAEDSRIKEAGSPGIGTGLQVNNTYTYNTLTAKNLRVSADILGDPAMMATTYNKMSDNSVDSADLLKDLVSLKTDKSKVSFRSCSSAEFLQCILSDVALNKQSANTFETNFTIIGQAITNQRLSVSGVDTDEEALNLVKFQHAYELSAKVIQTMTEMYDRLILNTGV